MICYIFMSLGDKNLSENRMKLIIIMEETSSIEIYGFNLYWNNSVFMCV